MEISFLKELKESSYVNLPSQGNIYSVTSLHNIGSCGSKVIVGLLEGKLFCIDWADGDACTRTFIPSHIAENDDIIAVDSFYPKVDAAYLVVGVTVIEVSSTRQHFNIYSGEENDLDKLFSSCQQIELTFIPCFLSHADVKCNEISEQTVWLLTGSDAAVHLYVPDEANGYEEVEIAGHFPEFASVKDVILSISLCYAENKSKRYSITGGEDGQVTFMKFNLTDNALECMHSCTLSYPVATTVLFFEPCHDIFHNEKEEGHSLNGPSALAVPALEPCFIFRPEESSSLITELPDSGCDDAVTCACVCDLDFDGFNEIVIGSYSQSVMVYKQARKPEATWSLVHTIHVSQPVLNLTYEKIKSNGTYQLLVTTNTGIHIFEYPAKVLASLILDHLEEVEPTLLPAT